MNWWDKNKNGFTIVELLIVVVVIAILAAITIVSFNGIQNRAKVATAQSDLGAISKKLEMYKAEHSTYPLSSDNVTWKKLLNEAAGDVGDSTKKTFVLCRSATGAIYGVAAWVPLSPSTNGTLYFVNSTTGSVSDVTYSGMPPYGTVSESVCFHIRGASSGSTWSHQL